MLTLYRRHLETCPHRHEGRAYLKCSCPIHCDGFVSGRRIRESMDTINWGRAMRRMAESEEDAAGGRIRKAVDAAVEAFLADRSVEKSTGRKYRRIATFFSQFTVNVGATTVDRITLDHLDVYRKGRKLSPLSWSKELQWLRTFFDFCAKRKWCEGNPAKDMTMPSDPKPKPRESYTEEEITRILAACDQVGQAAYERLRAKAIILLMRHHGLRISDVATLEHERVRNGQILLYAQKNGATVWAPVDEEVRRALELLPIPRGASADCKYFFWTGLGSCEGHVNTVGRTLQAVFRRSGVKNAIAHRFRHTLANELLVNGASIEDVANILGDSPAVIRKHYIKWSVPHQARITELLKRVRVTRSTRGENNLESDLFSTVKVVPGVGLEPTLPLPEKGF